MANPESVSELWKRLAEAGFDEDSVTRIKAQIEKMLHEMRGECVEVKVSADTELLKSKKLLEDAERKVIEADQKLAEAEVSKAKASSDHHYAERMLRQVKAREDALRRCSNSFNTQYNAKEKELNLERQALSERHKSFHQAAETEFQKRDERLDQLHIKCFWSVNSYKQATRDLGNALTRRMSADEEVMHAKRIFLEKALEFDRYYLELMDFDVDQQYYCILMEHQLKRRADTLMEQE